MSHMNQFPGGISWKDCEKDYAEAVNSHRYGRASSILRQALLNKLSAQSVDLSLIAEADRLAELSCEQGEYITAASLYRLALELRSNVLGPDHPDVKATERNLVDVLRESGGLSLSH